MCLFPRMNWQSLICIGNESTLGNLLPTIRFIVQPTNETSCISLFCLTSLFGVSPSDPVDLLFWSFLSNKTFIVLNYLVYYTIYGLICLGNWSHYSAVQTNQSTSDASKLFCGWLTFVVFYIRGGQRNFGLRMYYSSSSLELTALIQIMSYLRDQKAKGEVSAIVRYYLDKFETLDILIRLL